MGVTDRVQGVLLGIAAGDRIGGPVRMALRLAESLIQLRRLDPDEVLTRYLDWWRDGAFDTGPTAAEVFSLVELGVDPEAAVARVHESHGGMTAGCNPAHRSPPLAMAAALADDELAGAALREARLTHGHSLAGEVAAAGVVLCRALIRGRAWDEALDLAGRGRPGEVAEALACRLPPSPGGYAPDVLRAAVQHVALGGSSGEALGRALAFAGPENFCPVLVGAIAGARWGASSIPGRALAHCEILQDIRGAVQALSRGWE